MKKVILLITLLSATAFAHDGWFCTEESSEVKRDEIHACGSAYNATEDEARQIAFESALLEFAMICKYSASCHGRKYDVIPTRTECNEFKKGYKCYRMVKFLLK